MLALANGVGYAPARRLSGNLLTNSSDLTNLGSWARTNVTPTLVAGAGPGGTDAFRLTETVDGGALQHYIQQSIVVPVSTLFSCCFKVETRDGLGLFEFSKDVGRKFNAAGVQAIIDNAPLNSDFLDLGGGWYRCRILLASSSTVVRMYVMSGSAFSYTGNGSTLLVYNPQLYLVQ